MIANLLFRWPWSKDNNKKIVILVIFSNFCHFEPLKELLEGPSGAPNPYVSISILCYQISFELDHFQDFFTREEFFLSIMILKKRNFRKKCWIQLFLPFWAPMRAHGGTLKGSYTLFLNVHTVLSSVFLIGPFPRLCTANFFGEEFFQPKILLLKKGIFARNTALLGTHMYAAGADILSEFLVGLWL